jgi:hypothetical protein
VVARVAPDLALVAPDLALVAPDLALVAPDLALVAPDFALVAPDFERDEAADRPPAGLLAALTGRRRDAEAAGANFSDPRSNRSSRARRASSS